MINIIRGSIISHVLLGESLEKDQVSDILDDIEKAGMLPPIIDDAYADYYGGDSVGDGIDKYCKWEPEDEK